MYNIFMWSFAKQELRSVSNHHQITVEGSIFRWAQFVPWDSRSSPRKSSIGSNSLPRFQKSLSRTSRLSSWSLIRWRSSSKITDRRTTSSSTLNRWEFTRAEFSSRLNWEIKYILNQNINVWKKKKIKHCTETCFTFSFTGNSPVESSIWTRKNVGYKASSIYKCLNVPIVSSQIIPHPRFEDFQSTLARSSVAFVKYCTASQFSHQPGIKLILSQLFYSVIHSGLLLVKIQKHFQHFYGQNDADNNIGFPLAEFFT